MGQNPTTFEAWSGPICFYRLNCTIFDQLLLIKAVATRCQILRLPTKYSTKPPSMHPKFSRTCRRQVHSLPTLTLLSNLYTSLKLSSA